MKSNPSQLAFAALLIEELGGILKEARGNPGAPQRTPPANFNAFPPAGGAFREYRAPGTPAPAAPAPTTSPPTVAPAAPLPPGIGPATPAPAAPASNPGANTLTNFGGGGAQPASAAPPPASTQFPSTATNGTTKYPDLFSPGLRPAAPASAPSAAMNPPAKPPQPGWGMPTGAQPMGGGWGVPVNTANRAGGVQSRMTSLTPSSRQSLEAAMPGYSNMTPAQRGQALAARPIHGSMSIGVPNAPTNIHGETANLDGSIDVNPALDKLRPHSQWTAPNQKQVQIASRYAPDGIGGVGSVTFGNPPPKATSGRITYQGQDMTKQIMDSAKANQPQPAAQPQVATAPRSAPAAPPLAPTPPIAAPPPAPVVPPTQPAQPMMAAAGAPQLNKFASIVRTFRHYL